MDLLSKGDSSRSVYLAGVAPSYICEKSEYLPLNDLDDTKDGRFAATTLLIFCTLVTLAATDILADLGQGTTWGHVFVELIVLSLGLIGTVIAAQKLRSARHRAREAMRTAAVLSDDVEVLTVEAERWRAQTRELRAGLSAAIDNQFEKWSLTDAEKEIGFLLLKGLSHKEISQTRNVADTTIRQQARSLYRKAGLAGRNELSAFFLEDLLAPPSPQRALISKIPIP